MHLNLKSWNLCRRRWRATKVAAFPWSHQWRSQISYHLFTWDRTSFGFRFISRENVEPYHLRIGPNVEREDSCCQGTEELRTVPHWWQVGHVVVKIPKELHEGDRVLPQPGTFFLWLPRLERDTEEKTHVKRVEVLHFPVQISDWFDGFK